MSKSLSLDTQSIKPRFKRRRQSIVAFTVIHLLLPLALVPELFSWTGVALVFLGNYIFCSIGIGLCYHRTLTHRSLKLPKWLERSFAVLGVCSLQDSPCFWVATHRKHHKYSDEEQDPHSPLASFIWGHVGWVLTKPADTGRSQLIQKFAPDLYRDPFYRFLEHHLMWVWLFMFHVILIVGGGFLFGWLVTGSTVVGFQTAGSFFIWGVVVRLVYTWHFTWAVNSVAHIWGYRNYDTSDNSRNNWWVALATNGEGWHNNHHADQRSAAHGHRWWELDVTYLTIRLLGILGLAKDITLPHAYSNNTSVDDGTLTPDGPQQAVHLQHAGGIEPATDAE